MLLHLPLVVALLLAASGHAWAADFAAERARVLELGQLTAPPSLPAAEGFGDEPGLRPIFYAGVPWQGKPTKLFAWLGLPPNRTGNVPGVLVVRGGGGTAEGAPAGVETGAGAGPGGTRKYSIL